MSARPSLHPEGPWRSGIFNPESVRALETFTHQQPVPARRVTVEGA